MGAIFTRTFTDGTYPYLTLAGEELVRPLGIGNNWSSIRVIVACSLTPAAGLASITGAEFFVGICSGLHGYASAGCVYAVGGGTGIARTLTYAAGPPANYSLSMTGTANRNGTRAGALNSFTSNLVVIGPQRGVMEVLIEDTGAGGYLLNCMSAYTPATSDWNIAGVLDMCDSLARVPAAVVNGVVTTITAMGQASYTKYSDPLNALNIYWNKADTPLEIYSIAVSRVA